MSAGKRDMMVWVAGARVKIIDFLLEGKREGGSGAILLIYREVVGMLAVVMSSSPMVASL